MSTDVPLGSVLGERVTLPFVIVPCAAIVYAVYRFASRPILNHHVTYDYRNQWLVTLAVGVLFGHVVFHVAYDVLVTADGYEVWLMMGAFVFMFTWDLVKRVRHPMVNYTTRPIGSVEICHSLDVHTITLMTHMHTGDLLASENNDAFRAHAMALQDEVHELRARRLFAVAVTVALCIIALWDGLRFAVPYDGVALTPDVVGIRVWMYYMDAMLLTGVVAILCVYALYNAETRPRHRYAAIAGGRLLACLLATLPVVCGISADAAAEILSFGATRALHALAAGVLMWCSILLIPVDLRRSSARDALGVAICMIGGSAASGITSLFV